MLNAKLAPVLVMVGVTAAMWGCGDDDKPSGTGGRGGAAGSAGKAGSGSGGKAGGGSGGATGGSAGSSGGKAGGGSGGAGGTAGASGGTAGKGGSAGTGGNGGTAPVGGQGGEGGEAVGGAGGEGGGTGSNLTIAQACAASCQDQTALACDNACTASCIGLNGDTSAPDEYLALIRCQATQLGPNDYVCREQPSFPNAPDMPGLDWNGPCETELCAWTCLDGTFVDEDTFGHCGC